ERNTAKAKRVVFTRSEAQGLLGVAEIARLKQLSLVDEIKLAIADIKTQMPKVAQKEYDRGLLLKAQDAKLMTVDAEYIKFIPHQLGLYLKSQKAIDLLEAKDAGTRAEKAAEAQIITEDF